MDLRLTEDQELTRRMARDLAAKEIAPIAAEIDETGRFPREVLGKMAQAGLFGIIIPPPFGGAGGEWIDFVLAVEEIAAGSASVALSFVESNEAAFAILAFGNDEQRKRYLPALAAGEKLAGIAVCEPSGGANWEMTTRTRAVAVGDEYLVNGSKCFVSNASEADIYVVVVRTDPAKGPLGLSVLIVEKGTPGFSFGTLEDKFGLRGDPTGELVLADCRVPRRNLLGREGDGLKIVRASGMLDSVGQAAIAAGLARAALEATARYVQERIVVEPKTLADLDTVQSTVAEMAVAVESVRLLARRAALLATAEGPDPLVLLAATWGKERAIEVTGQAVRLHGGYGCTRDYAVGRYFRDAKTLSLAPPAMDAIKITAGKMLLGDWVTR